MAKAEPVQPISPGSAKKRLNLFERYLSLWVGLCMIAGVLIGKVAPALVGKIRDLEFGTGSQINLPIAVFIYHFPEKAS